MKDKKPELEFRPIQVDDISSCWMCKPISQPMLVSWISNLLLPLPPDSGMATGCQKRLILPPKLVKFSLVGKSHGPMYL